MSDKQPAAIIGLDTIESLALYNASEEEIGSAERIGDAEWHCEYRGGGNVTSGTRHSYAAAFDFLAEYGEAELAAGGFVDATATFRVHPAAV